ncbi:aromatic/alkene monooxygenase hydroxylase subunit beta [Rhodospirillum sp. A1_3_36]|uniref:aromatic/alkene monooxygenase hydroxylase subunit beta n=1 Tax=Rhodospirillum sp. A1_3_36 TaxID=3391666 RepID=UPI0039A69460
MTVELRTMSLEPRRHTFGHIARRKGADVPASRYEEGTLDLQATDNFHYKPLWEPEYWVYDTRKTAVVMADWYDLKDPRQYYYATYNIARANMQQAVERTFSFVEKRAMLDGLDADWREKVIDTLLPMRHVAWGANMNMTNICDRGYGTAVTAPCQFSAMDHLGMAQIISRIGLALDGNSGETLDAAKAAWMDSPHWQDMRRLVEDSLVLKDWFEQYVAQALVIDGVTHAFAYDVMDSAGQSKGGAPISMMTEFMVEWRAEQNRWVDAVIKTAAAESDANRTLISGWAKNWLSRAIEAVKPLCTHVVGDSSAASSIEAELSARFAKLGLAF